MNSQFLTFQQFNDPVLAGDLTDLLTENDIPFETEEESITINPLTAINNGLAKVYFVRINAGDFTKVNQLLKDREDKYLDKIEDDYYLFGFTDQELMEVIEKEDEWSSFDVELSKKILNQRGIVIDARKLTEINQSRIDELRAPDKPQTFWIGLGYICAVLGGILGIFIGWHLSSYKKTLPNGEQVYGYNEADRKHGKIIFYLAIIGLITPVILRFTVFSR